MYVSVGVYMYVCVCMCGYKCVYVCVRTCMGWECMSWCRCVYLYEHVNVYVSMHARVCVGECVSMCTHVYVWV